MTKQEMAGLKKGDAIVYRGQNPNYTNNLGERVEGRKWTMAVLVHHLVRTSPSEEPWCVAYSHPGDRHHPSFEIVTAGDILGLESHPSTLKAAAEWEASK